MRRAIRCCGVVLATFCTWWALAESFRSPYLLAMPPFTTEVPLVESAPKINLVPGGVGLKDPPTPMVCISVRVPASAGPGDELEYRLCVENPTFAPAHRVTVRNPLPEHAKFVRAKPEPTAREPELVWELGTLEACTKKEIILILSPTGGGDVIDCARVQFEHGQCVCTKVPKATLSLKKVGPTQAGVNETLTYRLTVANTGDVEARDVKITDSLPAGLEHASGKKQLLWSLGTLAPGQSRSVEYQAVAKTLGKHCNHAVATTESGVHEEVETCVTIVDAKLAVTKAGPSKRYVNLPATYDFTVTNEGTATLANVTLTDPVPEGLTFVSASDEGILTDSKVQWLLGSLDPGASRTVRVVFRAQGAVKACNRVTASAEPTLTAHAEICTEFVGISALLLEVVDTADPVELGEETTYLIIVRNQGSLPAGNVAVAAQLPPQEEFVSATGPAAHKHDKQNVAFAPVTLPARGEARFNIVVRAAQAGDVRFKVDLTADMLTAGPVHEEESTTLYAEPPTVREGRELSRPRLVPKE